MKKETCIYDKENKVIANHYCDKCGVPLCSSCGYVDPSYDLEEVRTGVYKKHTHYCNECFNETHNR